jgi:hypothetical protein
MSNAASARGQNQRGRLFLLLGPGLALLGIVSYVGQVWLKRLTVPWYMPILATLGVVLVVIALLERRNLSRWLVLVAVVLVAVAEWVLLYGMRLPPYAGPITVGRPFPAFKTSRPDGTPFTERDLAGAGNSVLVIFRGRW